MTLARTVIPARRMLVLLALAAAMLCALVSAPGASAAETGAWLALTTSATPTNLPPGGEGTVVVSATNLGYASVDGGKETVTLTDKLPAGLEVTGVKPVACIGGPEEPMCVKKWPLTNTVQEFPKCSANSEKTEVTCPLKETLAPYESWNLYITVKVSSSIPSGTKVTNTVTAEGGGTAKRTLERPLTVSSDPTQFGVENYVLTPEDEHGGVETRAGSQPFQLTTTLNLNTINKKYATGLIEPGVPNTAKDLKVDLPAGLTGNANQEIVPQCTELQFTSGPRGGVNECPEDTAVGVAVARVTEPVSLKSITISAPVYNLVPAPGEPARFGFLASIVPVTIDTSVREGDYHVVASVNSASQEAALLSSVITIWGVPGDQRHDVSRGSQCLAREANLDTQTEECKLLKNAEPPPFLTLPTSCEPLQTAVSARSWLFGAPFQAPVFPETTATLKGCEELPFTPSMKIEAQQHESNTPTGLKVTLKVPQPAARVAGARAEANVRDTVVKFPEGVQLNPSAANGLAACTKSQIGFTGSNPHTGTLEFAFNEDELNLSEDELDAKHIGCPKASKVGTVEVKTPVLEKPLRGAIYLAAQNDNPFNSLFGVYIVVKDKGLGVLVKLAGKVELNKTTGQVTSTFEKAPQLPFEEFSLELFNGPRASVATPRACGGYSSFSSFNSWAAPETAIESLLNPEEFNITSGPHGTPCANPQPFAPGFVAGTTNSQAGGFTPFTLTLVRPDTDQAPTGLTMTLPPGLAGYLSSVTQCPEPAASQGTCPESSLIGHATASSGLGETPFTVTGGKVYITGPYNGAPFGLSVVIPAKAGPFDFGNVVTRSTINIDPNTAVLTINSALPTMLNTLTTETGVPVQLRRVDVTVERPGNAPFQFNPTNCSPMSITGTVTGDQGASAAVSSPYQATGCDKLPFAPQFEAETNANFTKLNGTSLTVRVKAKRGEANIKKTKIVFPEQLPSRLTTIQKACRDTVFEANPANCPEGSVIGSATAHTPVLNSPLTGPAYLVSHGNAAFPDAEFVLQGEGITLVLDGQTNIHKGITSSTFQSVPDAPIDTFEVNLPAGPHSAFTGFGSLCKPTKTVTKKVLVSKKVGKRTVKVRKTVSVQQAIKLALPTELGGQNGDTVMQTLPLKVKGCSAVKSFKKKAAAKKHKKKKHTSKKKK